MKITVLTENNSRIDNYLLAEPALSLLIEHKDKKILFDVGYSDIFLTNAQKMGIDLNDITDIVISHGHNDHTGGFRYFNPQNKNIKLTAHSKAFDEKIEPDGTVYNQYIPKEQLAENFTLNLTSKPYYLCDDLIFLGEIENNFTEDIDDSAIVYVMGNKLFVITGCSHSGIINIIKQAKKITGINNLYGVIGGFHLLDKPNDEIEKIANYFAQEQIEYLAPCHCCDLSSKIILAKQNKIQDICVGDIINIA